MRQLGLLITLTLASAAIGCGGADKPSPATGKRELEVKPTVHVPPPVQHYEGTPYWLIQSRRWPALLEWSIGPEGEYSHDSLTLRLGGTVVQSFVSGPKSKEHPIMCWFELTVRPIPRPLVGYSFNIDSVIFFDPLKKKYLPALPMLSSERHTDRGVVRTRFSNNLALLHSPNLVEGQPLEPAVYITSVEKKSIKVSLPSMNVSFIKEIKPEGTPTDSLKWGPT